MLKLLGDCHGSADCTPHPHPNGQLVLPITAELIVHSFIQDPVYHAVNLHCNVY